MSVYRRKWRKNRGPKHFEHHARCQCSTQRGARRDLAVRHQAHAPRQKPEGRCRVHRHSRPDHPGLKPEQMAEAIAISAPPSEAVFRNESVGDHVRCSHAKPRDRPADRKQRHRRRCGHGAKNQHRRLNQKRVRDRHCHVTNRRAEKTGEPCPRCHRKSDSQPGRSEPKPASDEHQRCKPGHQRAERCSKQRAAGKHRSRNGGGLNKPARCAENRLQRRVPLAAHAGTCQQKELIDQCHDDLETEHPPNLIERQSSQIENPVERQNADQTKQRKPERCSNQHQ